MCTSTEYFSPFRLELPLNIKLNVSFMSLDIHFGKSVKLLLFIGNLNKMFQRVYEQPPIDDLILIFYHLK